LSNSPEYEVTQNDVELATEKVKKDLLEDITSRLDVRLEVEIFPKLSPHAKHPIIILDRIFTRKEGYPFCEGR
jgi:hypothetical protein